MSDTEWPADTIERRSPDSLVGYARNSKVHTDEQIAQVAASIREWGWTMPILVDEEGTILAGHARHAAARVLDLDSVPVIVAQGWSDSKKAAYVIADNRLTEVSEWDDEMLKVELQDLAEEDPSLMALTGFDAADLDALIIAAAPDVDEPSRHDVNTEGQEIQNDDRAGEDEDPFDSEDAQFKLVAGFATEADAQAAQRLLLDAQIPSTVIEV